MLNVNVIKKNDLYTLQCIIYFLSILKATENLKMRPGKDCKFITEALKYSAFSQGFCSTNSKSLNKL